MASVTTENKIIMKVTPADATEKRQGHSNDIHKEPASNGSYSKANAKIT